MVAEGTLEIRVVLPRDERGLPIPAARSQDYYHPKSGIFSDAEGNRIGFSGSINESETAWVKNYESFLVLFSWEATNAHLQQIAINFERLWEGAEPGWIAFEIPTAVRQRLLTFRPDQAPRLDPLEPQPKPAPPPPTNAYFGGSAAAERALFQFAQDAPYLPRAATLGAATAAITPWPHQTRVANDILAGFPARAMLSDEVGLGKTIEAGLIIRQLLISGRVKRCLILAPKSVLNQWQEELYEKFALEIPRYEDGQLLDAFDQPVPFAGKNVWDACDVLLASSQLAKRADRRSAILSARPWDLLVVDEAHHARRKDFLQPQYRANCLLSLLNELKEGERYAGLLLLTATPMQVSPLEVWDLLTVLGMGGRWGADEDAFLRFFGEMRKPFEQTDWNFVYDMLQDYLASGGKIDPVFAEQAENEIGPVKWAALAELPQHRGDRRVILKQLGPQAQKHVVVLAQRHTPLDGLIYRNTRVLLREYRRKGILKESVPTRRPEIRRVKMRPDEQALYDRIEEYISQFYQKYENERRGLGFVMTVYRRRLTSSFWAVRCSLERRMKYLQGLLGNDALFTDDDVEQDELDLDISEDTPEAGSESQSAQAKRFAAELSYVAQFLQELKQLSVADSKLEVLKAELNEVFKQRDTVLVFTQYADTMDYLRDQLRQVYGSEVACYSGGGGEVWNGIAWVTTTKDAVKADFRTGKIRILIGTESASEGINLQTCGVLINYDMPWNPMRVEQRIGRIDRIGQVHPVVWISNYFYAETIEDQIYQRLADRINWFEVVVGDLQPILAEVAEVTRRLAMLPASEREKQLEADIKALAKRIDQREVESLGLDKYLRSDDYHAGPPPPITLAQLEDLLTHASATGRLFRPHESIPEAYWFAWQGSELAVTFSPACFDEYPTSVRFLSYGSPLLAGLLAAAASTHECPAEPQNGTVQEIAPGVVRCCTNGDLELRAWYTRPSPDVPPALVSTFEALTAQLQALAQSDVALPVDAQQCFAAEVVGLSERFADVIRRRRKAHYLAVRAKAQWILLRAAFVELALGQNPSWLEDEAYPSAFNQQAVLGLQRHGYPWTALLRLAYEATLFPSPDDAFYKQVVGEKYQALRVRFAHLKDEAGKAVSIVDAARKRVEDMR
jgi:superfamily II DNA or RNA helicase